MVNFFKNCARLAGLGLCWAGKGIGLLVKGVGFVVGKPSALLVNWAKKRAWTKPIGWLAWAFLGTGIGVVLVGKVLVEASASGIKALAKKEEANG
jgi:hypothetical protein